ncbi:hypothetical protein SAMN05518865_116125 [Duganella sp. CF458]|uniref:hypothetical protein n=1 Tax=Duganella sp. CF458 TaxID=1884368 RepID=UPI0008F070DA|nr:hypothetical protein [Duganella sp. CF458]SFG70598.1 hypothetical protein SAMN05518865_116125 [Duganella sp. CF458]
MKKVKAGGISALIGGMLAFLVLDVAFPQIDPRDFANLIGLAAVIGAMAGAWLARSNKPGDPS